MIPKLTPVLDAGCGNGRYLVPLLKHGFDVYGLDITLEMLQDTCFKSKKVVQNAKGLINGDIAELPFKKEAFGVILCLFGVLAHLSKSDRIRAIQEFNRVLRKNGILILSLPNKYRRFYMCQLRNYSAKLFTGRTTVHEVGDIEYLRKLCGRWQKCFYHLFSPSELKLFLEENEFGHVRVLPESLISEIFSIKNNNNILHRIEDRLMRVDYASYVCYDFICICRKKVK